MKKIAFHGASGEVTGSAYVVTAQDDSQLLVDFGMFQGPKEIANLNYEPLKFNPANLAGVVLTHAHLDHCGRLPMLVYGAFRGKIYMTSPTFSLVEVILNDAAKVAQEKADVTPLYSADEVAKVLDMIEIIEYEKEIEIGGFKVKFIDAGHILGSASIEVVDKTSNKKAVFSGDLGNTPEDIIKPTTYCENADYVVMETTYGDKDHQKEDPTKILQEEINTVEGNNGVLLIPAFSLERTQELLHKIHHLKKNGKMRIDTPVFMDSPMGIRATEIFKHFREFYNEELQSHDNDPFSFEGLASTIDARDSKDIIKAMEPKIIIAGSGMMSGGRILGHALNYLPRKTTRILFVGYQAEETLGRQIISGKRNVIIYGKGVKIRANVRTVESLSSHAGQTQLFTWLKHIKGVKKVFLTHGDVPQRQAFAEKVTKELHLRTFLPINGDELLLEGSPENKI